MDSGALYVLMYGNAPDFFQPSDRLPQQYIRGDDDMFLFDLLLSQHLEEQLTGTASDPVDVLLHGGDVQRAPAA